MWESLCSEMMKIAVAGRARSALGRRTFGEGATSQSSEGQDYLEASAHAVGQDLTVLSEH